MQNVQNLQSVQSFSRGAVSDTFTRLYNAIISISGLAAYYPLNETSGNALNKAPATIGTLDGTVSGATQGVTGLAGKAYSFDGINDKVTFPEVEFTSTSKLSIIALLNPSSVAGNHMIMTKRTGSNATFQFRIGETAGDKKLLFSWQQDAGTNQNYLGANATIDAGAPVLVGVSFDWETPDSVNIFKNGVKTTLARSAGTGTTPLDTNVGITIGTTNDDALDYAGTMQHVARYTSLLTDAQHLQLAQLAGLA